MLSGDGVNQLYWRLDKARFTVIVTHAQKLHTSVSRALVSGRKMANSSLEAEVRRK
jgi:hypothetical protein